MMPQSEISGMPDGLRIRFRARATVRGHRFRVEHAEERVRRWIRACVRPYVAFSGGKDSAVVLHLVRATDPSVPAVYLDASCSFPEVDELLDRTPDLLRWPCAEPFLDTLGREGFDSASVGRRTMEATVWEPVRRLIAERHYDGVAYGIRAEESPGRRASVAHNGYSFRGADGVCKCQPIGDWTYDDVWAYIVHHGIDYCGTYDRMWDMPEDDQRISYWAGETKIRYGRWAWLKRNYPNLFAQLCQRIPEAASYA